MRFNPERTHIQYSQKKKTHFRNSFTLRAVFTLSTSSFWRAADEGLRVMCSWHRVNLLCAGDYSSFPQQLLCLETIRQEDKVACYFLTLTGPNLLQNASHHRGLLFLNVSQFSSTTHKYLFTKSDITEKGAWYKPIWHLLSVFTI